MVTTRSQQRASSTNNSIQRTSTNDSNPSHADLISFDDSSMSTNPQNPITQNPFDTFNVPPATAFEFQPSTTTINNTITQPFDPYSPSSSAHTTHSYIPGPSDRHPTSDRPTRRPTSDLHHTSDRPLTSDRHPTSARPSTSDHHPTSARPSTSDRHPTSARPHTSDRHPTFDHHTHTPTMNTQYNPTTYTQYNPQAVTTITTHHQMLIQKYTALLEQYITLNEKYTDTTQEISSLNDTITNLSNLNQTLQHQLQTTKQDNYDDSDLQQEIEELAHQINCLNLENESLITERNELRKTIDDIQSENIQQQNEYQTQINKFKYEISRQEIQIRQLSSTNNTLSKDLDDLHTTHSEALLTITNLTTQINDLKAINEALKEDVDQTTDHDSFQKPTEFITTTPTKPTHTKPPPPTEDAIVTSLSSQNILNILSPVRQTKHPHNHSNQYDDDSSSSSQRHIPTPIKNPYLKTNNTIKNPYNKSKTYPPSDHRSSSPTPKSRPSSSVHSIDHSSKNTNHTTVNPPSLPHSPPPNTIHTIPSTSHKPSISNTSIPLSRPPSTINTYTTNSNNYLNTNSHSDDTTSETSIPLADHGSRPSPIDYNSFATSESPSELLGKQMEMFANIMMKQQEKLLESHARTQAALFANNATTLTTITDSLSKTLKKGPVHKNFLTFDGDPKKFKAFHHSIMACLIQPEWALIYDKSSRDTVPHTTPDNAEMSTHLYSAIIPKLTSKCVNEITSFTHSLMGKGIELLQAMRDKYYPRWPSMARDEHYIAFKKMFRLKDEAITTFSSRFQDALSDLEYNNFSIPPLEMRETYISLLGYEFKDLLINENHRDASWHTFDFTQLERAASEYLAKYQAVNSHISLGNAMKKKAIDDAALLQNKNKDKDKDKDKGKLNPKDSTPLQTPPLSKDTWKTDWQSEISKEIYNNTFTDDRKKHWQSLTQPHICLYHRDSSKDKSGKPIPVHSTDDCTYLKTALQHNSKDPIKAKRVTATTEDSNDDFNRFELLDIHEDDDESKEEVTAHCKMAKAITTTTDDNTDTTTELLLPPSPTSWTPKDAEHVSYRPHSHTPSKHKMVKDSGATRHMMNNLIYFISINYTTGKYVQLGDGKTRLPIVGIGTVQFITRGKIVRLHNVLYVPTLDTSLFSIRVHIKYQGCQQLAYDNSFFLTFPTFTIEADMEEEITMPTSPITELNTVPDFDESTAPLSKMVGTKNSLNIHVDDKDYTVHMVSKFMTKDPLLIPSQGTPDSVGFDLKSPISTSIPPNSRKLIPLGFKIAIPKGLYGRIAPRSGLALNHHIDIGAGVIDPDYRGEVKALLINSGQKIFHIHKGDKIAQLIFEKCAIPSLKLISSISNTLRAQGGFGSTDLVFAKRAITPFHHDNQYFSLEDYYPPCESELPTSTIIPSKQPITNPTPNPTLLEAVSTPLPPPTTNETLLPSDNNQRPSTDHLNDNPSPIRSIDTPCSSISQTISLTVDDLRKYLGYSNIDSIKPHLKNIYQDNFHISTQDREPVLELGETTTLDKNKKNSIPLKLPKHFGDCIHVDIVYGTKTGLGGVRYALLLVDKASRYGIAYPLMNLKKDIKLRFQQFVAEYNVKPKLIRTDYDKKLMGANISEYLHSIGCKVESAPPRHQRQNGLVERHWRTIVRMARAWINQHLLPSSFWFHAIKRAMEIYNYLPVSYKGLITTPFELVHHIKPDIRNLFPMFSVAYIEKDRLGNKFATTFQSQSIKCIAIGKSSICNSLEFYHPPSGQIFDNANYILDPILASGPVFNLKYDGGLFTNHYHNDADTLRPPAFDLDTTVFYKPKHDSTEYRTAIILTIPTPSTDYYTIQDFKSGNIHQIQASQLHISDPSKPITNTPSEATNTLPGWIKHNCQATLFTENMNAPKRGSLQLHDDTEWYFHIGTSAKNKPLHLPNFITHAFQMIHRNEIFEGHPPFPTIYDKKRNHILRRTVVNHISAAHLKNLDPPTLLSLQRYDKNDQQIHLQAYDEEYNGLVDIDCWTPITEEEYQKLKKIHGQALPTMAISTIKHDENGKPKRCKWRIVALGNLDPHHWDTPDCYAPVLSQYQTRFMASLSIHYQRKLKNLDIKQAFVQAYLPEGERYILKPPPGCPRTKPGIYWLLKRSLYGLKRSAKLWYLAVKHELEKMGFTEVIHSPCFFQATFKGKKVYCGLYVDDIIYFGETDEAEKYFEQQLASVYTCDFMGTVSHFLGIKFSYIQHKNQSFSLCMSQQAFIEQLVHNHGSTTVHKASTLTPYRSGYPIDSIQYTDQIPDHKKQLYNQKLMEIVGSLSWLCIGTRPDISTIVNILAQHQQKATVQHIKAAQHVINYLKSTSSRGIIFSPHQSAQLSTYLHFPVPNTLCLTDANWGPQDQSEPDPANPIEMDLFKARSMSGFIIISNGPLFWSSKRQKITARSSAEAEIYATDECTKMMIQFNHMIQELNLSHIFKNENEPFTLYNDNLACVQWSKNTTTKGLRHITIRENAIRESIKSKLITVKHIDGKINIADIFTKEDKDPNHFIELRNMITYDSQNSEFDFIISHSEPVPRKGGIGTDVRTTLIEQ